MATITDHSALVTDAHRVLDMASNGGTPYDALILEIEEGGNVALFVQTYYGGDGTRMDVWHGRTRQFTLIGKGGAHIDLNALRADLRPDGRLAPLIDRIAAGLDSDWDGSNFKGTLTADARKAEDELDYLINHKDIGHDWIDDTWSTWDTSEWLDGCKHEITADMTDDALAAWANDMEETAEDDRVRLVGDDVIDWAKEVRADKRADAADDESA
jgi:hypothetical protein